MAIPQQNQQTAPKAVKWAFLALNWRLTHIIIAAARLACSYLKTIADDPQPGNLPSACEALC